MANFVNNSANMSLPIPVVTVDPGPDWAANINIALTILDSHDHSPGKGVPITPSGMNISADLPFNNNNATLLRSSRFQAQPAALSGALDIGCVYVSDLDLYYNDIDGNQIRLTQGGSIVGTAGSISGLPSGTASASYQSVAQTFLWQSATNTAANLDAASIVLRNLTANSFGLTLSPPVSLGSDYALTLPAIPAQTNLMTLDTSGNMGAAVNVDNTTLQLATNVLSVKDHGITQVKKALMTTGSTVAAGGFAISSNSGSFSTTSLTQIDVTNLSVTITTTGRPVYISLVDNGDASSSITAGKNSTSGTGYVCQLFLLNGTTAIAKYDLGNLPGIVATTNTIQATYPMGMFTYIDAPAAGTYTYKFQAITLGGPFPGSNLQVTNVKLIAYEI